MELGYKTIAALSIIACVSRALSQNQDLPFRDVVSNITYPHEQIKNGVASQYRDGDIVIGLMIAQHTSSNQKKCGDIETYGVQVMETVNMLIEKVNANPSILPGVKLGTLAIDTCTIGTHTFKMIVGKTFQYYWQTEGSCNQHKNRSTTYNNLKAFAGFIGAGESGVTIFSSKILQVFQIPQISFFSTNPDLSDKKVYPYVFRTVPSDVYQAEAMIKFVQENGWNYISVVYSDTLYGSRAFSKIKEQASKIGVCIAVEEPIEVDSSQVVYDNAIKDLLKEPKAKVVILFAVTKEAEKVLKAAENSTEARDKFTWIASDGWTSLIPNKKSDTSYISQLKRTIGFMPKASALPDFEAYFRNIHLKDRSGENSSLNPWFAPYLSKQLGCDLQGSATSERNCTPDDSLGSNDYHSTALTHYMSDAVLVMVQALDRLHRDICGGKSGLCRQLKCTAGTNELAKKVFPYLRNASITGIHGGRFTFDRNQDGLQSYGLRTYVKLKDEYIWVRAGLFEDGKFIRNESLLQGILNGVSSICSTPCQHHQRKKISADVCCWTCINCSSNSIVTSNGSECTKCQVTEKPNSNRNECVSRQRNNVSPNQIYTIVPMIVSTLGVILTTAVVAISIKHQDTPIVKACSKESSLFVIAGVIICFLDAYVMCAGLNDASCATIRVFLSLGPAFMYSGLLTKTLRIVIIFQSTNVLKKHKLGTSYLKYNDNADTSQWKAYIRSLPQIVTTVVLIILQVFILTIWFLVTPNTTTYTTWGDDLYCDCSGIQDAEIMTALAFPFVLIIVCTTLATINRNVPSGYNETRLVGFTMYTTCVTWLAFVPIVLLNTEKVPLKIMVTSICLSLSAITVISCLYVPRCYVILFQPELNTSKAVMDTSITASRERSRSEETTTRTLGKSQRNHLSSARFLFSVMATTDKA